ncbi:MAG: hypothetical protein QOI40_1349, partial [Alphaproteobacteria bacterium]|nr:hypothetical protein [Alphaproteobacteria bacterium]
MPASTLSDGRRGLAAATDDGLVCSIVAGVR